MASAVDDLLACLKTVPGIAAVFDTNAPDGFTSGASPAVILQLIHETPETTIDGPIHTETARYQVSVIGRNVAKVRAVVAAVKAALHGFRSDAIKYVSFESMPGIISDGYGPTREYHAPVDFTVTT